MKDKLHDYVGKNVKIIDNDDGEYVETKFGEVHYSKTGTHVVPFIHS
ncbi:polymorphic toxin type 50 domain-containing protein [Staphylococcus caeli]